MSRTLNPNRTNLRSSGKRENERPDGGSGFEGAGLFLDVGYFSTYNSTWLYNFILLSLLPYNPRTNIVCEIRHIKVSHVM